MQMVFCSGRAKTQEKTGRFPIFIVRAASAEDPILAPTGYKFRLSRRAAQLSFNNQAGKRQQTSLPPQNFLFPGKVVISILDLYYNKCVRRKICCRILFSGLITDDPATTEGVSMMPGNRGKLILLAMAVWLAILGGFAFLLETNFNGPPGR